MAKRHKISLIGAGNIGGELANLAAQKELGDVVLFDIPAKADFAKGKALDLEQNGAILGYDARITGTSLFVMRSTTSFGGTISRVRTIPATRGRRGSRLADDSSTDNTMS